MARYALLLRGVNIGMKNSLPMTTLRDVLTDIGCAGVRTWVQSGNAVFITRLSPAEAAAPRVGHDAKLEHGAEGPGIAPRGLRHASPMH